MDRGKELWAIISLTRDGHGDICDFATFWAQLGPPLEGVWSRASRKKNYTFCQFDVGEEEYAIEMV